MLCYPVHVHSINISLCPSCFFQLCFPFFLFWVGVSFTGCQSTLRQNISTNPRYKAYISLVYSLPLKSAARLLLVDSSPLVSPAGEILWLALAHWSHNIIYTGNPWLHCGVPPFKCLLLHLSFETDFPTSSLKALKGLLFQPFSSLLQFRSGFISQFKIATTSLCVLWDSDSFPLLC